MLDKLKDAYRSLIWSWAPASDREASDAIAYNILLHWFPVKVTERSKSWGYTAYLGTISFALFVILSVTGVVLMFYYVPSIERAYQSVKDMEFVVSYGWFIRRMHRWAAHLMVAAVFLHMIRVFLTGAYRSSAETPRANRPLNWIVGMLLLLFTLLLSYTGYLLPWDQLALWAITIGANIALSAPVIGKDIQFIMQGGTLIDQNTLIIWYATHVAVLPLLVTLLVSWHMWRVRKDGGLAAVDAEAQKDVQVDGPVHSKTYSLMGAVKGVRPTVVYHKVMGQTGFAIPDVLIRVLAVSLFTAAAVMFLSVFYAVPLEEPASLQWTPNPAKAPWYFLWLQELVTITTIPIGSIRINGGFVGGVIIPTLVMGLATAWPYLDKTPDSAIGIWFAKVRRNQIIGFLFIIGIIATLTIIGTFMRGPNWGFYWPWEAWPAHPTNF